MQAEFSRQINQATLAKTINQLTRDAERLRSRKSPAAIKRALDKLDADMKQVLEVAAELISDDRPPPWAEGESTVKRPVLFVREFLDKNPEMSSKEAFEKLKARGVNPMTARTQYYRWKKAHH